MDMSSGALELNHEYPYFITAIKHGYLCFISILTRPYLSNVLH